MVANKRLRSLQSLLWESDQDNEDLRKEWFGKTVSPAAVHAVEQTTVQEENAKLRIIIQDLRKQVTKLSNSAEYVRRPLTNRTPTLRNKSDDWHWLHNIDQSVAQMPRMVSEVVPSLRASNFCNGCLKFDMHYGDSGVAASTVLAHCQASIENIFCRHPAIFKIGLTKSPVPRWNNNVYGYANDRYEKWAGMKVLFVHSEAFPAGLVESALIQHFQGVPGCRNVNLGGEGVDKSCPGPYFTYVVFRVLTPPARSCT